MSRREALQPIVGAPNQRIHDAVDGLTHVGALTGDCIDLAIDLLANEDEPLTPAEVLAVTRAVTALCTARSMAEGSDRMSIADRPAPIRRIHDDLRATHRPGRPMHRPRPGRGTAWRPPRAAVPTPGCVPAHHDLAAALVHLGTSLSTPLATSTESTSRRRRGGPDAQLLRSLEAVARPRDWDEPSPYGRTGGRPGPRRHS